MGGLFDRGLFSDRGLKAVPQTFLALFESHLLKHLSSPWETFCGRGLFASEAMLLLTMGVKNDVGRPPAEGRRGLSVALFCNPLL